MNQLMSAIDIDAATAHAIAAAMREVSRADGVHPAEEALIDAFLADLPPEGAGKVDLDALADPAHREAFLKSLLMVALADGELNDAELGVVKGYATKLGVSDAALHTLINDVGSYLLSAFHGVHVFRDEVVELGHRLGLDDAAIDRALAEEDVTEEIKRS